MSWSFNRLDKLSDDFDIWFNKRKKYFEELFKAIDKIFEETFNQYKPEVSNGNYQNFPELGPFLYGYSITIGPDGVPIVKEFGNLNPKSRLGKEKELIVDVFERNNEVKIIAEVPGVSEGDIKLDLGEDSLSIKVEGAEKYFKIIPLPSKVDPRTLRSTYKNGVLEISIAKSL